jgi:drug/metabolite transporter (DMT)-like permease
MSTVRAGFAALFFGLLLKRHMLRVTPVMIVMGVAFAVMNICYVTSITLTTAANAIILQYTAPLWVFIGSVLWLKEPVKMRSLMALAIGSIGVVVILTGAEAGHSAGIGLALISGVAYATVVLCLRQLREEHPLWLTFWNHAAAFVLCLPVAILVADAAMLAAATPTQWAMMAAFGIVQMGVPYLLFSHAVRYVPAHDAALLTLIEPVLNPLFTYFATGEQPASTTIIGGVILLAALVVQVALPSRQNQMASVS